jgi:hypothetical protein
VILRERRMVERHERRALAPGRNIGKPKPVDDRYPEPGRHPLAEAELTRERTLRAVIDGLAMEADKVDRGWIEALPVKKNPERIAERIGYSLFEGG